MRSYTVYITLVMLCLIISSLGQAAKPGRHDRGTVFSFHFNEGNGKVTKDFSGNENHAKLGGNKEPKWVKGPELHVGTALAFSNANFIEIPESQKLLRPNRRLVSLCVVLLYSHPINLQSRGGVSSGSFSETWERLTYHRSDSCRLLALLILE